MQIAVLALQGAFIEHEQMLERIGVSSVEIRQKRDLERHYDGLIIPGGESTVQGKLMRELGLFEPIKEQITEGLPVFGTCAGLLLLAKDIKTTIAVTLQLWTLQLCAMLTADSSAAFIRKQYLKA